MPNLVLDETMRTRKLFEHGGLNVQFIEFLMKKDKYRVHIQNRRINLRAKIHTIAHDF